MNIEMNYGSDSDTSDEDFCPDDLKNIENSELSEESSDDDVNEDQKGIDEKKKTKQIKKSKEVNSKKNMRIIKENTATKSNESEINKCSTRQSQEAKLTLRTQNEKQDLESDDEQKARADALWADFLGDVKETKVTPGDMKKTGTTQLRENDESKSSDASGCSSLPSIIKSCNKTNSSNIPDEISITEIMDFAGEEVKVQKTPIADSIKENKSTKLTTNRSSLIALSPRDLTVGSAKRPLMSGGCVSTGLGPILNQIGKKSKISVLEKTKLDWNSFKKDEGIEEELQTFNKGKDGFLERQDFLERTDLRQFEIERNLRQTRRK